MNFNEVLKKMSKILILFFIFMVMFRFVEAIVYSNNYWYFNTAGEKIQGFNIFIYNVLKDAPILIFGIATYLIQARDKQYLYVMVVLFV